MIFAEDFVHEKKKRNITLAEVQVGDEIFAYDFEKQCNIWTKVIELKRTGERDLVNITFKNTHHIRLTLDHYLINKRNEFETVKDVAFEVSRKPGYHLVKVMNDGYSEIENLKKYEKLTTMQLVVENVDNNFYVNGVCVKCG